jgi:hypothetical protein
MSEGTYRVGNHQPRNPYRGDEYIGVMFDPADTAMIARMLNGQLEPGPEAFRDGDGDWWDRQSDQMYMLRAEGTTRRTLEWIKETYGAWKGEVS